jgi:hypothetical protein
MPAGVLQTKQVFGTAYGMSDADADVVSAWSTSTERPDKLGLEEIVS